MNDDNQEASQKILERIRRLLAMGSDKSSEKEAAIALRRARSLMDEHQVTLSDIEKISDDSFGGQEYDSGSSRQKLWVNGLAIGIAQMNDCIFRFAPRFSKKDNWVFLFQGFRDDVKLCEFMLVYLVDTCLRLYQRDKKALGLHGLADKTDYLNGISNGIRNRIQDIIDDRNKASSNHCSGRSLVVTKQAAVEEKFGIVEYREVKGRDPDLMVYLKGMIAADEIHLGNFVESEVEETPALEN